MPRIFDNINSHLLPTLQETLRTAERADFCVGYFNLRGWQQLAPHNVKQRRGEERTEYAATCRLLVGMHVTPSDELRHALRRQDNDELLDNQTAQRDKRRIAEEFRQQLTFGSPSNQDEAALRQLAAEGGIEAHPGARAAVCRKRRHVRLEKRAHLLPEMLRARRKGGRLETIEQRRHNELP